MLVGGKEFGEEGLLVIFLLGVGFEIVGDFGEVLVEGSYLFLEVGG